MRQVQLFINDEYRTRLTIDDGSILKKIEIKKSDDDNSKYKEIQTDFVGKKLLVSDINELLNGIILDQKLNNPGWYSHTKLVNRIFSAVEEGEEEVVKQIDKDINTALKDGSLSTEEYDINKVADDKVEIIDKVNDETTTASVTDKEVNFHEGQKMAVMLEGNKVFEGTPDECYEYCDDMIQKEGDENKMVEIVPLDKSFSADAPTFDAFNQVPSAVKRIKLYFVERTEDNPMKQMSISDAYKLVEKDGRDMIGFSDQLTAQEYAAAEDVDKDSFEYDCFIASSDKSIDLSEGCQLFDGLVKFSDTGVKVGDEVEVYLVNYMARNRKDRFEKLDAGKLSVISTLKKEAKKIESEDPDSWSSINEDKDNPYPDDAKVYKVGDHWYIEDATVLIVPKGEKLFSDPDGVFNYELNGVKVSIDFGKLTQKDATEYAYWVKGKSITPKKLEPLIAAYEEFMYEAQQKFMSNTRRFADSAEAFNYELEGIKVSIDFSKLASKDKWEFEAYINGKKVIPRLLKPLISAYEDFFMKDTETYKDTTVSESKGVRKSSRTFSNGMIKKRTFSKMRTFSTGEAETAPKRTFSPLSNRTFSL